MKKFLTVFSLAMLIVFTGCSTVKGSFMDFAAIKNAERTMTKLNNLMEQYYVENGTYPQSPESFEEDLRPYFISFNRNNEPTDQWDDMVGNVFADGKLFYETNDPKITYFITGRALDSGNTVVFCRPAVPHTEEKE